MANGSRPRANAVLSSISGMLRPAKRFGAMREKNQTKNSMTASACWPSRQTAASSQRGYARAMAVIYSRSWRAPGSGHYGQQTLEFSPDGKLLVCGTSEGIEVRDA